MVRRLEQHAARKKEREAAALKALDDEAKAAAYKAVGGPKRLGDNEQKEIVRRLEQHATRKKEREAAALKALDDEAKATAYKAVGGPKKVGETELLKRLYEKHAPKVAEQKRLASENRDAQSQASARDRAEGARKKLDQKKGSGGQGRPASGRADGRATSEPLPFFSMPPLPKMDPASGGEAGASRYDTPRTAAVKEIAAGKMPSEEQLQALKRGAEAPAQPPQPAGEQFELTVPEGVAGGEELNVQLPDGRTVVVSVPEGLAVGDEFIAIIPTE